MAAKPKNPLIVIVGPTASGKSSLALRLAKKYNGEIICADSRTIYKNMDIGTAKPTKEEQKAIKHHMLDLVEPGETFTAADFQSHARAAISDIHRRGKVPFLVGGTGLYIDSVIFNYKFSIRENPVIRKNLENFSLKELWDYCVKNYIELPKNKHNKRYVIRAIEQRGINKQRNYKPIENCYIVGIATEKIKLRQRIEERANVMFNDGVINEAIDLASKYGWDNEAMTANIYRLAHKAGEAEISIEEAKQKFITLDWKLAKRQLTWLRRNHYIRWHTSKAAYEQISGLLESRQKDSKRATM